MIGKVASALAIACAGLLWIACNTCPFAIANRITRQGTVACCGASLRFDITVEDVDALELDLANTQIPQQTHLVDVWLTAASCDTLFEGTYPSASPRCQPLIGPVAPGAVSTRIKAQPGPYRVFVQAYTSNTTTLDFNLDVGVWGRPCRNTPAGP